METINDIVREMRNLGELDEKSTDRIPRSLMGLGLRTYADRLKAAAKREKAQPCNAAKMREALEWLFGFGYITTDGGFHMPDAKMARNKIEEALSESPRNCDLYKTLDDARNAFFADYVPDETCSSATAFAMWLFAEAKGEQK